MSQEDHKATFERLVQPHFDRLWRLALRLTGRKPEAEDLFQELLIKAFGKLDDLVAIEKPGPWLCRVMYNLFIDERRRYARQRMHTVDEGFLPDEGLEGMAGDDDPIIPITNAVSMAARIPDSRLEVIEGGGHLFLYTRPAESAAKLVRFLDDAG